MRLTEQGWCLSDVIVALFQAQPCETQRRLSTTAMLFRQLHRELMHDFAVVPRHCTVQGAITIHNEEAEHVVTLRL